jgi:hypothetical protein
MIKLACPVFLTALLLLACTPGIMSNDPSLEKPVIEEFNTSHSEIDTGGTAVITWTVIGASSVTLDPNIGVMPSSGNIEITPDETTIYTIHATNQSGTVDKSLTITVIGTQTHVFDGQDTSKLPTIPVLLSPVDGAVFNHYPRTVKLKWVPSKGEIPITYLLKIEYDTRETPGSFQGSYPLITLTNIEYSLDFVSKGTGRWCVMARNEYGASNYCNWWHFQFTR